MRNVFTLKDSAFFRRGSQVKKSLCALVAFMAAAVFLPASTVAASALPESATFRDRIGDVRGPAIAGRNSIDIYRVSGTREGKYLIGRMRVANLHNDTDSTDGQLFVLWVQTRSGITYQVSTRNQEPQTAPLRGDTDRHFCARTDVIVKWHLDTDVVVWKIPMKCFKEHPVAWRVGGISFIGRNQEAWDQTGGGKGESRLSGLFANTP